MFKKLCMTTAILAVCANLASANEGTYFGGTLGMQLGTVTEGVALLSAGYAVNVGDVGYVAGEVFADPGVISLNPFSNKMYSYGASVIPGVRFHDDTIAYGRVGVMQSHFQPQALFADAYQSTTVFGKQLGVGVQRDFTKNLSLRAEYIYIFYNRAYGRDIHANQINVGAMYTLS